MVKCEQLQVCQYFIAQIDDFKAVFEGNHMPDIINQS